MSDIDGRNLSGVAETLLIMLYIHAMESQRPDAPIKDEKAVALPPGNRLEKLSGDRAGQHNIRINDQWRGCFRWTNGDAHDVEIVGYH
jgi:O-methyltransferase involved in polyketide biosynthesis